MFRYYTTSYVRICIFPKQTYFFFIIWVNTFDELYELNVLMLFGARISARKLQKFIVSNLSFIIICNCHIARNTWENPHILTNNIEIHYCKLYICARKISAKFMRHNNMEQHIAHIVQQWFRNFHSTYTVVLRYACAINRHFLLCSSKIEMHPT